jgi:hypothetical protein
LRPAVPWTQGHATNSRAYARLAKNRQLEIDATEIRTRSDRPARRAAVPNGIQRQRQQLVEAYEAAGELLAGMEKVNGAAEAGTTAARRGQAVLPRELARTSGSASRSAPGSTV